MKTRSAGDSVAGAYPSTAIQVLLDAHILGQRETGNETYLRNLVGQSAALENLGAHLTVAVSPGQVEGIPHAIVSARLGDDVYRLTSLLPRLARDTGADLVHVTYHGPLSMRTPMVVTIHDVSYRVRMRFSSLRNALIQNALGYWTARRARLIITVSEFCRTEIARVYPFAAERIAVTYEAVDPMTPLAWIPADDRLRALGITGERFVFCIGRFQPRKNMARLARAFLSISADRPGLQLVLAGENRTPTGDAMRREFAEAIRRGQILLPGYVGAEDAAVLYDRCACFAFPSLYEGFGLPVLEAMQRGAPVVTSSTTALPEIAGDAAILVDPADEAAIAAAIARVIADHDFAAGMAARGRTRAAFFDGPRFARATADAYARALRDGYAR